MTLVMHRHRTTCRMMLLLFRRIETGNDETDLQDAPVLSLMPHKYTTKEKFEYNKIAGKTDTREPRAAHFQHRLDHTYRAISLYEDR